MAQNIFYSFVLEWAQSCDYFMVILQVDNFWIWHLQYNFTLFLSYNFEFLIFYGQVP